MLVKERSDLNANFLACSSYVPIGASLSHQQRRDVVKMAVVSSLPFCGARTSVTTFPEEQQDLERTSLTVLYSNVRSLRQAYGELCKTCTTHQPAIVCLTETHLFQDATDAVCPAEYVVAARRDRSLHGGGVIIMVHESILFDEVDTTAISVPELSEVVAIHHQDLLLVCCYRQPSSNDLTLFRQLDLLLDSNTSLSPVICGDFNVHEASWLHSPHTTAAGTAALDFCESRGLHQLIRFPTRLGAMLDLILSEHTGTTIQLPNLNTSDHVTIYLSLRISSYFSTIAPPPRRVFHWSHAPWRKLSRYFNSIRWSVQGTVDDAVTCFANNIHSATMKFIPSCIPKNSRPTPWWNRFCEEAWQHKIACWHRNDSNGFLRASVSANLTYKQAIQDYKDRIKADLRKRSTSKRWWSLTKNLLGSNSTGTPMTPSARQLAEYFSSRLSHPNDYVDIPALEDCHNSLFSQFRIKTSCVKRILLSLDVNKSIGDDNVSPRVLKSCASALCGPLSALSARYV